jgi:hypothetical protein
MTVTRRMRTLPDRFNAHPNRAVQTAGCFHKNFSLSQRRRLRLFLVNRAAPAEAD